MTMYTVKNYKTKKEIKEAIAAGEEVTVYQPGPFGKDMSNYNGSVVIEGPHFPMPHRYYGQGKTVNGKLVSIK